MAFYPGVQLEKGRNLLVVFVLDKGHRASRDETKGKALATDLGAKSLERWLAVVWCTVT